MSNALILTLAEAPHGQDGPYGEFGAFRAGSKRSIQFLLKPARGKTFLLRQGSHSPELGRAAREARACVHHKL